MTLWLAIALTSWALLTGCVSYGPALLGNEQPVVPVATLDSVPTVTTGAYGTLGWPIAYWPDDNNTLMGAGYVRAGTRPQPVL